MILKNLVDTAWTRAYSEVIPAAFSLHTVGNSADRSTVVQSLGANQLKMNINFSIKQKLQTDYSRLMSVTVLM